MPSSRLASRCSAYSIHVISSTPGAAVFFRPKKHSSSATASGLPDNVPATTGGDSDGDLPVPVQKASAHARVYDDAGSACVLRYRHPPCCLLWDGKHQHPELVLRRSIPAC